MVARLELGIEGAAFATGLSQVIPFVAMQIFLGRKTSWRFVRPVFRLKEFARMCYNGLSEFVDEVSIGISVYIFNLVLMIRIGAHGVAAFSIAAYVGEVFGIIFFGVAQAIHAGVSFNKGAGQMNRVKGFRNIALYTNFAFGLLAFVLLQFLRDRAAAVFVKDIGVIDLASEITFFYSFAMVLMGVNITSAMFFTAIDRPAQSAIIALSRSLVMLLIGLALLPLLFGNTGIWLTFVFAETITLFIAVLFYRRQKL
jgi:Na+-driven multidrug efflux pump